MPPRSDPPNGSREATQTKHEAMTMAAEIQTIGDALLDNSMRTRAVRGVGYPKLRSPIFSIPKASTDCALNCNYDLGE